MLIQFTEQLTAKNLKRKKQTAATLVLLKSQVTHLSIMVLVCLMVKTHTMPPLTSPRPHAFHFFYNFLDIFSLKKTRLKLTGSEDLDENGNC